MKDSRKQWQRTERSAQNQNEQHVETRLIEALEAHIESLKQQVEDQKHLIQVLSDDKYFKPAIIQQALPPVESVSAFEPKDYEYATSDDEIVDEPETHDQTQLLDELEGLAQEQAEYKQDPRAYARK
jgi:hypothetical protein